MNNYPGKLIVLYGINNLGKSTQAKLLVKNLQKNGHKAEYLKYPIYDLSPSGEMLNDYLRNGNFFNLSLKEAQILYALNRTQYQKELINKLKEGINIIAEDYKGTGIAWGLGGGLSETFLKEINSHLIDEDLVFLFDGERFRNSIEKGHRHENNEDLMNKVRWAHLKLKEDYSWIKINANQTIPEIENIIWQKTKNFIEGKKEEKTKKQFYNYSGFNAVGDIISSSNSKIISQIPAEKIYTEKAELAYKKEIRKPKIEEDIENLDEIKERIKNQNSNDFEIIIEKVDNRAKLPKKANLSDAGYDIYSLDFYSIPPYGQDLIKTGIKIDLPENHVALIWDKSGLASQGITTMGGVIDSGYHGEIKIVIKNLSEDMFNIIPGQKIAQMLVQKIENPLFKEGKINNTSERGNNGFGSSGKF